MHLRGHTKETWKIPRSQDRRSVKARGDPEAAVELGGVRGQRAERKQETQTKASSAAAPQRIVREAPAHVSRLPPVLFLSLCGCRHYFSFPPVVVILKDLTSFVNLIETCRSFFFLTLWAVWDMVYPVFMLNERGGSELLKTCSYLFNHAWLPIPTYGIFPTENLGQCRPLCGMRQVFCPQFLFGKRWRPANTNRLTNK